MDGFHEDESFEQGLNTSHDDGKTTRRPLQGVPDESTDSQRNTEDGRSHNESSTLKLSIQVDEAITAVSWTTGHDVSVSCVSDKTDKISGLEKVNAVTNHLSNLCAETETNVGESETVCNTVDKGCPPNQIQSDADSCLTELSEPKNRSVYEVDDDPLALEQKGRTLEQNLCMPEMTEPQTSYKHTDSQKCAVEIKDQIAAPEVLCGLSQTEDQESTKILHEDKTCDVMHMFEDVIADQPDAFPGSPTTLDTHLHESKDHISPPHHETVAGTFEQSPSILATTDDLMEAISENKDQHNNDCTSQTFRAQQIKEAVSSKAVSLNPNISIPRQDPSTPDMFPKLKDQSDVDLKCMPVTSNHAGYKRYRPSFSWDTFVKATVNTQTKCAGSNVDFLVGNRNSKPSLALTQSTLPKSDQRTSGFLGLEFFSPHFMKDKLTNKASSVVMKTLYRSDTPSKRPHQKSDFREEWDAIKQSYSEMLAEKEDRVLISYSSTVSGSLASSSVGNGLRQDDTPTVSPPKLQTETEGGTANSEGKEQTNQSDIVAQIAEIEELMSLDGSTPQKIRKID